MKVLISPGFGAGWSTWNQKEMAVDKDLINLFEKGCTYEEMRQLCIKKGYSSLFGGEPDMGGFGDLEIEEVPKDYYFKIMEYDGSEYIEIFNPDNGDWIKAED